MLSLHRCKRTCHNNAKLNLHHAYWDKLRDVISNFNITHSQKRMCTPRWEQVGHFINKLLNITPTQMPPCKILATGRCALKSEQSQDNRLADPEVRLHLRSSIIKSFLFLHFLLGPVERRLSDPEPDPITETRKKEITWQSVSGAHQTSSV